MAEDTGDTEDPGLTELMKEAQEEITQKLAEGEHPFKEKDEAAAEELEARDWKTFFKPKFSENYEGSELEGYAEYIRTHLRTLWDEAEAVSFQDLENFCRTFETEEEEESVEWKIAKQLDQISNKKLTKLARLIQERTDILEDYPGKMRQQDIIDDIEDRSEPSGSSEESLEFDRVEIEEDVAESLTVEGTEIKLNPSTEFEVEELYQDIFSISQNQTGLIKKKKLLKLYQIKLGEGTEQEEQYLITDFNQRLPEGKVWKPIRFLSPEDDKETLKLLHRKINPDQNLEEFIEGAKNKFLGLADKVAEESKEDIKNLSNEQLKRIVLRYLNDGYNYDPKIKKALYPLIVKHKREEVEPKEVVRKSPHMILLTNSSVGKTFIGRKVGKKRDSASLAGLIGYADSDKVQKGELHKAVQAQLLDEFTRDSHSKKTGDGLLSIMEIGIYNNTRAGKNIQTELYAPIAFMTNPEKDRKELSEDTDDFSVYLEAFNDSIRDLGGNFAALGSRFGLVLFDENLQPVEGNSLPREERRKLQSLVDWILEEIAPKYSQIEEECDWIDEPFNQNYQEQVRKLSQSISFEPEFQEFWRSHLEAYRHTKGLALRAAVLEHLSDLLNDDYSVEEITETAKDHLEEIRQINLESLLEMIQTSSKGEAKQRKRKLLESEDSYVEYFIRSVIRFYESREDAEPRKKQPLGLLKDEWKDLKHEIDGLDDDSRYWRFSKLQEQLKSKWSDNGPLLRDTYGIRTSHFDGEYFFSIDDEAKFKLLFEDEDEENILVNTDSSKSSESSMSSDQTVFKGEPSDELIEQVSPHIPEEGVYEQEVIEAADCSEEEVIKALNWLEDRHLIAQENGEIKPQDIDLREVFGDE
jgi:hypothetical protein